MKKRKNSRNWWTSVVCWAATVLMVQGCSCGTMSRGEFNREWGGSFMGERKLFDPSNSRLCVNALGRQVGEQPIRAIGLSIFASHAILTAQDPRRPTHLRNYIYADHPVKVEEPGRIDPTTLERDLFDPKEVEFDKFPTMIARGEKAIPLGGASLSHLFVRNRSEPTGASAIEVCVWFKNQERSAAACFDNTGTFRETVGL